MTELKKLGVSVPLRGLWFLSIICIDAKDNKVCF